MRRLSNDEFEDASTKAEMSGVPLSQCPTCGAKGFVARDEELPDLGEAKGWINGAYRYRGEEHECDCEHQMELRKHYLVANIGEQYMRLDWADYDGAESVRDTIQTYLDHWSAMRANGMGLELGGGAMGTGKTFAGTHVGKELIKRGVHVYFIPFLEIISLYQRPIEEQERLNRRLRRTTVLILDEVRPPGTAAQQWLFSERFEELIRHRTNFNLPTIIGTNLTQDELHQHYPRTYSLLCAKQLRVEFTGKDQRMSRIADENLELVLNDEVRPIT